MRPRNLSFYLLIFLMNGFLWAEGFFFDTVNIEEGLANPSVSSIVQDSRGFLWFGTQGGLNRYDGRTFLVYENEPFYENTLPHNLIQTLYLDTEDVLWIGTYGGLSRFDINMGVFTNYYAGVQEDSSLSGAVVTAITRAHGDIWVGTLQGLDRLDEKTGKIRHYYPDPADPGSLPHKGVRSLFLDSKGNLWAGTGGGISRYNPETDSFETTRVSPDPEGGENSLAVMSIRENNRGEIWLGVWSAGACRFIPEEKELMFFTDLPNLNTYFIYPDGDFLWVGSWGGGLFLLNPATGEVVTIQESDAPGSLSSNIVYSFLKDEQGLYWIGTNGGGINKLNLDKKQSLAYSHEPENPESLSSGKVTSILKDSHGIFWSGSYINGLDRLKKDGSGFIHYRSGGKGDREIRNEGAAVLYEDTRQRLWLGGREGLELYDRNKDQFFHVAYDPRVRSGQEDIVYAMEEDLEGNYWIGTYNKGLVVWDRDWKNVRYYMSGPGPDELTDNLIFKIFCDSHGDVWVATNSGLNRYNAGTNSFTQYVYNPRNPQGLNTKTIRVLFEDSRGDFWLGTESGGMNLYNRKTDSWTHFTKKQGLPHDRIMAVLEDSRQNLWISTAHGMAVMDLKTRAVTVLKREDGLYNPDSTGGAFSDTNGDMYFGSVNGINLFTQDSLFSNTHIPPVYITGFKIFNEPLAHQAAVYNEKTIELLYNQNYLEIDFAALDYNAPESNQYAYKMEGFDREWNYVGSRSRAFYTNLPPGKYQFLVSGSNNNGIWNPQGVSMTILVSPSPWLSWWAVLIYVIAGYLVVYLAVKAFLHREARRRVKELEEIQSRLEEANQKLETLSGQDSLTGLANRRSFDTQIESEWNHAQRERTPLALLMLDIDYFKNYNDLLGHQQGDVCLCKVANLLKESLSRSIDFAARYGGEEFCILLPNTDSAGALRIAQRIQKSLDDEKIPFNYSQAADFRLTMSIGIAVKMPESEESVHDFINRADKAMYKSKAEGRNLISQSDPA